MRAKKTPARVASGTGVGEGRCDSTPNHSKNDAKRTASQRFAEGQLLAAIEIKGGRAHIAPDDWATWKWRWFITPRQAAEAACRLADDGVLTVDRRDGMIFVARAAE